MRKRRGLQLPSSAGLAGVCLAVFTGASSLFCLEGVAVAQTIRDTVREHVEEGLEREPERERQRRRQRPPRNGADKTKKSRREGGRAEGGTRTSPAAERQPDTPKGKAPRQDEAPGATTRDAGAGATDARGLAPRRAAPGAVTAPLNDAEVAREKPVDAPPAPASTEPPLPWRVFGKGFELDAKIGGGIRGWYPDQYPLVSVSHASYATWSLDLKAKLFGFLRLHRGYYESNGLQGPRTRGAVVARDIGQLVPKAAWLLGTLGVPLSRRWETLVSYETRSFVTRARPSAPVAIVERDTPADSDFGALPRSDRALEFVSGFETLVLGVRYFPERGNAGLVGDAASKLPPMYFGVGFTQYSKPYQVRVGSDALDELLFNGQFRGAGLAYGFATARRIDGPYMDVDAQLGLGQVSLLDDLTLNELLPEDWLIGYLQGRLVLGYILPLLRARPTPLLTAELSAGGATFFYFEVERNSAQQASALPLNWDIFWAIHGALTLPL